MPQRASLPGPSQTASSRQRLVWGAPAAPVMESTTFRLEWGWSGYGLQPTSLTHKPSGASVDYLPGFLWAVELNAGFDATTALRRFDASSIGNENITVEQTTDEVWSITWNADGARVTLTVSLLASDVDYSFAVVANTSGERVRSIIGPLLRFEAQDSTDDDVYVKRQDRLVNCFWTTCLINDPVNVLFDVDTAELGTAVDPNFIPGFSDPAAPGYTGFSMGSPGVHVAEFGGYYNRAGRTFQEWHTTDVDGYVKNAINFSNGEHLLIGWRHWVKGGVDNTYSVPYSVRVRVGASSRTAGLQWLDIGEAYRDYLDALSPVPGFYVRPDWDECPAVRDVIACWSQLFVVKTTSVAQEAEVAVAALEGDRTLTIRPRAGAWVNDPLSAPDNEFIRLSAVIHRGYGQVISVEAGSGQERVLRLNPPLNKATAVDEPVEFTVDPFGHLKGDPQHLADLRAKIANVLEWYGITGPELFFQDYLALPYAYGDDTTGFPYWCGTSGWNPTMEAHREAVKAMGVLHVLYGIAITTPIAGTSLDLGLPSLVVVPDDGDPVDTSEFGQIGGGGRYVTSDQGVERMSGESANQMLQRMRTGQGDGLYWDAHFGRAAYYHRPVGDYLTPSERGDPANIQRYIEQARRFRDTMAGEDADGMFFTDDGPNQAAIALDASGALLVDARDELGIILEGDDTLAIMDQLELRLDESTGLDTGSGTLLIGHEREVHTGEFYVDESGTLRTYTLSDHDGQALVLDEDTELDLGIVEELNPRYVQTTENTLALGMGAFNLTAVKQLFPLDFNLIQLPQLWALLFQGQQQTYDLTDKQANLRNRTGVTSDFGATQCALQLLYHLQSFQMGMIQSFSMTVEATALDVGDLAPGTPIGADLQTFERMIAEMGRHFALWDRVPKVKQYRRYGGKFAAPIYGQGLLTEAWERQDVSLFAAYADAWITRDPAQGLMIGLANISILGSDASITLELDGDEWPEVGASGARVFELFQDGTETEVAGAIVDGSLTLTLTVLARSTRILEVRS